MRLLLDTHLALWAVVGSRRLPLPAREAILAADEVYVSAATVWEIVIKHALGKGDMPISAGQAYQAFQDAGYELLDVKPEHAVHLQRLPSIHRDPFDRILVAQAAVEPMNLMTSDAVVARYSTSILHV